MKQIVTPRQLQLLWLLANGCRYSIMEMAYTLRQEGCYIGDPRSVIRDLRKKMIPVLDRWKRTKDNKGQYKLYWIEPSFAKGLKVSSTTGNNVTIEF
ncbi:MAG: hypothetical protein LUD17_11680 [Bacteroidales bacterium]|nr:hypothetical protein [Bacteroidales bacterium]